MRSRLWAWGQGWELGDGGSGLGWSFVYLLSGGCRFICKSLVGWWAGAGLTGCLPAFVLGWLGAGTWWLGIGLVDGLGLEIGGCVLAWLLGLAG